MAPRQQIQKIKLTLRQGFYSNRLVIGKAVVLRFDASMVHESTSIGHQTTHGSSNVTVDFRNLFYGLRIQQRTRQSLFDGQDSALLGLQTDGCGSQLDGFNGVFDLNIEID